MISLVQPLSMAQPTAPEHDRDRCDEPRQNRRCPFGIQQPQPWSKNDQRNIGTIKPRQNQGSTLTKAKQRTVQHCSTNCVEKKWVCLKMGDTTMVKHMFKALTMIYFCSDKTVQFPREQPGCSYLNLLSFCMYCLDPCPQNLKKINLHGHPVTLVRSEKTILVVHFFQLLAYMVSWCCSPRCYSSPIY